MKRDFVLWVLIAIAAIGLCNMSESQTSSGPASSIPSNQPPAGTIGPDGPIVATPKPVPAKQKTTNARTVTQGGVLLPMTITYRPWKGLIAIDGLANGNNPARFIVSTGLNISTVSPEDAIRLQLTTSSTKAHVAVLDTSTDVPTASILNLRVGPGILHNINVAQVNLISLLTREPAGDAPTCWLGTSWLSDYLVTLDFETHALVLNSKSSPFAKPTGTIVPFRLKDGKPVVKVNVAGGGSFEAIVDTGEMGTLIPSEIALKIMAKKLDKNTPKVGVDVGAGKMGRMVLPKITVGKAEIKNLMVAYYGTAAPTHADKTMAIIGTDFLRRFRRVTISYAKSQMELLAQPTADSSPPTETNPVIRKPGQAIGTTPFGTNPSGINPTGTVPH